MSSIPIWMQVTRLLLTFLITSAAGMHAYVEFKRRRGPLENPLRWGFWLYSALFLFTAVLNFVYLLITVGMRSYGSGPFKLGTLSLILVISYVTIVFGSGRRSYTA